jgi:uncharacterized SAM-dependent methyltransferase
MKRKSQTGSDLDKSNVGEMIFKEFIKRGYSLEGDTRVWNIADSKFWYFTPEQAQAFIDLEKNDSKQRLFVGSEVDLLRKNFSKITLELGNKPVNVIDLGCGNGEKALVFIRGFKDKSKIKYCPIDVSSFMVEKAFKTISKVKGVKLVKLKNNTIDFLDLDNVTNSLRKGNFKTNFLLLLGGSLENSEVHQLLHDIKASMKENDYLLIGNKLTHPDPTKMVEYYNAVKLIDSLLFKTLSLVGFNQNEVKYAARFRGSRIEMFYTILKDKIIENGGKKIPFKAGDKIIIAISYKYTKDKLLEILNLYFENVELFMDSDEIYTLALCKK